MNISKLQKSIEISGLKKVEIAEKCGFSRATLDAALRGDDVKVSTIEKLASVLEVPVGEFFNDNEVFGVRQTYNENLNDVSSLMSILSRFLRNQEQYQDIMKDMMKVYERINNK